MDVEDQENCQTQIRNEHTHAQKNKNRIQHRSHKRS